MVVTFDAVKSEKNARDRGLPFTMAADIDFATALAVEDTGTPTRSAGSS